MRLPSSALQFMCRICPWNFPTSWVKDGLRDPCMRFFQKKKSERQWNLSSGFQRQLDKSIDLLGVDNSDPDSRNGPFPVLIYHPMILSSCSVAQSPDSRIASIQNGMFCEVEVYSVVLHPPPPQKKGGGGREGKRKAPTMSRAESDICEASCFKISCKILDGCPCCCSLRHFKLCSQKISV